MAEDDLNERDDIEEAQDTESSEESKEEKGSKKKLIIIIAIVAALLSVITAIAYFSGALEYDMSWGKPEKKPLHTTEGENKTSASSEGPLFIEIPDLIVNLSTTGKQARFLKLKVQIEVKNADDLARVEAVAPRVIDHFQTYLRELRVDDLKGSAGIYRLRQELVRRVNAAAYPVEVEDVLFQEILIQ